DLEHRYAMRKAVLFDSDTDLVLAILKAYRGIADRYEYWIVLMLADGLLTRTRDRRIQLAAQECLRALDPTYKALDDNELLRPAASSDADLLRPASISPS